MDPACKSPFLTYLQSIWPVFGFPHDVTQLLVHMHKRLRLNGQLALDVRGAATQGETNRQMSRHSHQLALSGTRADIESCCAHRLLYVITQVVVQDHTGCCTGSHRLLHRITQVVVRDHTGCCT